MIGSHPLAHRRRAIWFAVPGDSLPISRGCAFSTLPGFNAMVLSQELVTRQFGTLRFNLGFGPLRCAPIGGSFSGSPMGVQASRLDRLSLTEAVMRMKNPGHPRELVEANLKELGLCVAEAAKAIGVIRQQLYNVVNGRSAVTPEMAVGSRRRSAAAPTCS
jgi:hypothetical protein